MIRPPPKPTLFPYTPLFRSSAPTDRRCRAGQWQSPHRRPPALPCSTSTTRQPIRRTTISRDRKSTRLNSSHGYISYAVFCLKKKKKTIVQILTLHQVENALE